MPLFTDTGIQKINKLVERITHESTEIKEHKDDNQPKKKSEYSQKMQKALINLCDLIINNNEFKKLNSKKIKKQARELLTILDARKGTHAIEVFNQHSYQLAKAFYDFLDDFDLQTDIKPTTSMRAAAKLLGNGKIQKEFERLKQATGVNLFLYELALENQSDASKKVDLNVYTLRETAFELVNAAMILIAFNNATTIQALQVYMDGFLFKKYKNLDEDFSKLKEQEISTAAQKLGLEAKDSDSDSDSKSEGISTAIIIQAYNQRAIEKATELDQSGMQPLVIQGLKINGDKPLVMRDASNPFDAIDITGKLGAVIRQLGSAESLLRKPIEAAGGTFTDVQGFYYHYLQQFNYEEAAAKLLTFKRIATKLTSNLEEYKKGKHLYRIQKGDNFKQKKKYADHVIQNTAKQLKKKYAMIANHAFETLKLLLWTQFENTRFSANKEISQGLTGDTLNYFIGLCYELYRACDNSNDPFNLADISRGNGMEFEYPRFSVAQCANLSFFRELSQNTGTTHFTDGINLLVSSYMGDEEDAAKEFKMQ